MRQGSANTAVGDRCGGEEHRNTGEQEVESDKETREDMTTKRKKKQNKKQLTKTQNHDREGFIERSVSLRVTPEAAH